MGTRADFYVRHSENDMHWIGSVCMDGYPETKDGVGVPKTLLKSRTMQEFCNRQFEYLNANPRTAIRSDEWTWPWNDSTLTDYSYVYDVQAGKVIVCRWGQLMGGKWKGTLAFTWPNMKDRRSPYYWVGVNRFKHSGMTVMESTGIGNRPRLQTDN